MSKYPEIDAVLAGESEGCIIHSDCIEVMAEMSVGWIDVLTDPPYGIGKDGQRQSKGGHGGRKAYEFKGWDKTRPCKQAFQDILRIGREAIIWGGNYFADMLPPTMGWLVWDKGQRISQSDGELAWTSRHKALRIITINRNAIKQDGATHPTQKPVKLMTWCLCLLEAPVILDPFCGSGTTCIAAKKLGRRYVGIEIDERYAELARNRIRDTEKPLFT